MRSTSVMILILLGLQLGAAAAPVDVLSTARAVATNSFPGAIYGTSAIPEKVTVDCTKFLLAVVRNLAAQCHTNLTPAQARSVTIAGLTKAEMTNQHQLVEEHDPRMTGVQGALVGAGLGKNIVATNAAGGDLVQYWYKEAGKWQGHSGIVETVGNGLATIYGAHRTTLQSETNKPKAQRVGGIGSGPKIPLTSTNYIIYAVRWNLPAP